MDKKVYLKQENLLKSQSKKYRIADEKRIIGYVEEDFSSSKDVLNQLFKFIGLYSSTSLHLKIFDRKDKLLGQLKRGKGFNQIYTYTSKTTNQVFRMEPKMSIKNPSLNVCENEQERFKASGSFGAQHFTITNPKNINLFIIKKTVVPVTLRELFMGTDVYELNQKDELNTFFDLFIAINIVLDLAFHER